MKLDRLAPFNAHCSNCLSAIVKSTVGLVNLLYVFMKVVRRLYFSFRKEHKYLVQASRETQPHKYVQLFYS